MLSTIFYSASFTGFYSSDLKEDYIFARNWPEDLVEVSDEDYRKLMAGASAGKMISPDANGNPILVDVPGPSPDEILAKNSAERDARLSVAAIRIAPLQDAVDLDKASTKDKSRLLTWKTYRVAVNRVDLVSPEWPSVPE